MMLAGCAVHTRAEDAGVDVGQGDAFAADAYQTDAPPIDCDDHLACTLDLVDDEGRCTHRLSCPRYHACSASGACEMAPTCVSNETCLDLPCQTTFGCWGGHCRYEWDPDHDADGVVDVGCGGTDCAPRNFRIPREEQCNREDDDCDERIDEDFDFQTDVLNCGQCGLTCAASADRCVEGACTCSGAGEIACDPSGSVCFDGQTDVLNCGACGHACPEGSPCEAGQCRYRPTWETTFDVSVGEVWPAPNGDLLVVTGSRPRTITYGDRHPPTIVPIVPRTFAVHVTRLDRDGIFLGVAAVPQMVYGRAVRATNDGFYYAGVPSQDVDLFGQVFRANVHPPLLAYVPNSTYELAWVAPTFWPVTALRGGDAVAFGAWGEPNYVRYAPTGMQRPVAIELGDRGQESVFARPNGGFIRMRYVETESVPVSGYATGDVGGYMYDASGRLTEIIRMSDAAPRAVVERSDGEAWIVLEEDGRAFQVDRGPTRNALYEGRSDYLYQVAFDESGFAAMAARDVIRWRDGVEVARVALPASRRAEWHLAEGVVWTIEDSVVVGRMDLPPGR